MRERPILFSGAMVRAILAGQKTQTRRVVKFPRAPERLGQWEPTTTGGPSNGQVIVGGQLVPNPEPEEVAMWHTRTCAHVWCPHGRSGDRLWVRETWCSGYGLVETTPGHYLGNAVGSAAAARTLYRADGAVLPPGTHWRPSIFMPRDRSRLTLAVKSVRVERLQDISEEGARAEGVEPCRVQDARGLGIFRDSFANLWNSINGARPGCSWEANPWVWVVGFTVAEARR